MDLENSTAPETTQSGEQPGVVAPEAAKETAPETAQEPSCKNADFNLVDVGEDDAAEKTGEAESAARKADAAEPDGAGQAREEKKAQTHEENAAIRAARLRAQRDAEAAAEARAAERMDAEIAKSGAVNPYTGKPFTSMKEFREYGEKVRKAELDKQARKTGRTVEQLQEDEENRRFLSDLRAVARKQQELDAKAKQERDYVARDVLDFVAQYPEFGEAELGALENNRQFRQFCGSRFGREPLAKLYGDYLSLVGDAGAAAVSRAEGKSARSTGGGGKDGATLSPAQKSALDAWNAEHPEMAMTAKEFLGR